MKLLRGFYHACDLFVAPSRYESFGLVLVEAMMFGKPVVSCKVGGIPEVVVDGATGLLAEPGDAASLESCLAQLIESRDLRDQMAASARKRYLEHFSPAPTAKRVAGMLCRRPTQHFKPMSGSPNTGSDRCSLIP